MSEVSMLQETMAQALTLHRSGEWRQAETLYRRVLKQDPDYADAWHLLGLLSHQQGGHETALRLIQRAIQLNPKDAAYHVHFAEACLGMKQPVEAMASLRRAMALEPTLAVARANLANVLYEQDQFEEALQLCQEALALDPVAAATWDILGNLHEAMERHEAAQEAYRHAIALDPTLAKPYANLGISLERSEIFPEAAASYAQAIAQDPGCAEAHWNRSLMLLKLGDFGEGWEEYEWRWKLPTFTSPRREFPQPLWEGQHLHGKRILMHAEQGFGDAIQFVRYAPLLTRLGAQVIIECPLELVRLFRTVRDTAEVMAAGGALPSVDYQVPFMSLPRVLKTRLDTIPAEVPYLRADVTEAALWRKRLQGPDPTVGLVWAGRPTTKGYNAGRSMNLQRLAPLFQVPNCHFVSLQKGAGTEQLAPFNFPILDTTQAVEDFADLASILAAVDLVISVDTAAAHLAGALGKPVWTLVPKPPAFQWMLRREDSPWYPTMRLFRQEAEGEWDSVVERLAQALKTWPQEPKQI